MTEAQIKLARQAMALPGAPKPPELGGGCIEKSSLYEEGLVTGQRAGGILWIWWPLRRPEERIPDLCDPTNATGGVLWKLSGSTNIARAWGNRLHSAVSHKEWRPGCRGGIVDDYADHCTDVYGDTMAEVACHVAEVKGGWFGGAK